MQTATSGSLGTVATDGYPFVSLVNAAAVSPTSMAMLLSGLARHSQNLKHDERCSLLLIESVDKSNDPLQGTRVTLNGHATRLNRDEDTQLRQVFLNQHPQAAMYAEFGDFSFYQFNITEAHLVAGFGRIATISASDL